MKLITATVLFAAVAGAGLAAVRLVEDPPPVRPPKVGGITGRVTAPGGVIRLRAVSRVTGRIYKPASLDPATGRFVFENLPEDATYDLCVKLVGGREVEGIDLEFADARLLRLAEVRRKQLNLPPRRSGRFSMDDVRELQKFVRDMKDFMEIRRILYIRGHGLRATMLVELVRTRKFHQSGGRIIWRVELWYFLNQFGGWQRLANQERLLRRAKTSPQQWRKIHVEYYPKLSVYVNGEGKAAPVVFEIPAAGDITRGRVAGTKPHQKTTPHILGLDVKPYPPAATKPATAPVTQPVGQPAAK